MNIIKGIPVSPGVVIGKVFVLDQIQTRVPYHVVSEADVPGELERLEAALEHARAELDADRIRAEQDLGPEPAKIFAFHLGLLQDPTLVDPVRARIVTERVTAAYAVAEAFRTLADRFRAMGSEVFRQKANDVLDLDHRLLGSLVGQSEDRLAKLTEPVVVVTHEMTPAQAASLDTTRVLGFATDAGGRTSHTSIVAAALDIPVVVGCQDVTRHVNDGDEIIIDGKTGTVIIHPDDAVREQYEAERERVRGSRASLLHTADLEPVTKDGTRISLLGNIEFAEEIDPLLAVGGDGVGLFRTEFLYLASNMEPTEEEHYESYVRCLKKLNGRVLTIRTMDLGADKATQSRSEEPERNPFLGLRSIRYALQHLPMFRTQLRAVLRASAHGPIKVMFPLVSTLNELRQTRMILHDVMEECQEEGIEFDRALRVGVMIEVPSAALMSSHFAREVDFFSIGTNDLIQYTLAVDRGNERVANLYTAAHPAVIMLIKQVIRAGKRFGVDTSLCGEIAGEVTYTMLLIGLGLRTLSLVPAQIPRVKQVIRAADIEQCERLARKVGSFDSERQVLNCLRDELAKILPETTGGWSAE
jgi:phosphotransferase system enzyme I (PtsI)